MNVFMCLQLSICSSRFFSQNLKIEKLKVYTMMREKTQNFAILTIYHLFLLTSPTKWWSNSPFDRENTTEQKWSKSEEWKEEKKLSIIWISGWERMKNFLMQKARMGRNEKEKERNNHLSCVNMRMASRVKLEDEWNWNCEEQCYNRDEERSSLGRR